MRLILLAVWLTITIQNCFPQINTPKANQGFVEEANKSLIEFTLTSNDLSDLEFLRKELQGKRIVYLGESNHHSETFNEVKFKFIQFLHSEMGFNVIAFESSISSCLHASIIKTQVDPFYMLTHSILGCWRTESMVELMRYIQTTDMNLAGFDPNQNANILDSKYYNSIFADSVAFGDYLYHLDSIYLQYILKRNSYFHSCNQADMVERELDSIRTYLLTSYTKLETGNVFKYGNQNSKQYYFLKLSIRNKLYSLKTYNQINFQNEKQYITNNHREQLMQENLEYLLDSVYPNEKMIIWAHNDHISKGGPSTILGANKKNYNNKSMGYRLKNKYGSISYTIGLYGYPGLTGKGYTTDVCYLPMPKKNSLESILFNTQSNLFFLKTDIKAFRKPLYNFTEKNISQKSIISDCYDAVIFIQNLQPAVLINSYDKNGGN